MAISAFATRVYAVVSRIPIGFVLTYADVARLIGSEKAMRAVGTALAHNPRIPEIPCHRVVRSDGSVGQYAHGADKKIALLTQEGISIYGDKVDLSRYRYQI